MQFQSEEIKITILIGTFFILFFSVSIVLLFIVFNEKKKLNQKEKEIIKATFEQTILQSQLEIQEQTFNTISQEIHDNVGQILSLAKVQLNIIDEQNTADKTLLSDAKENISKAMTDLRDIAKGLSSERIRALGLMATVDQEVQRINRTGIFQISLQSSGTEQKPDNQQQLIVFRVIQECLHNIVKHAAASAVGIRFQHTAHQLTIVITDNGRGFDLPQARMAHQGLGLENIFKRIELIGGQAAISSIIDEGTTIQLTIPYA